MNLDRISSLPSPGRGFPRSHVVRLSVPAGRIITDPELDEVAPSELRIQSTVEESQVPDLTRRPQLLANSPDVLGFERGLYPNDTH